MSTVFKFDDFRRAATGIKSPFTISECADLLSTETEEEFWEVYRALRKKYNYPESTVELDTGKPD